MRTFPRSRIDALTDGIFAFAMTLLVLDVRLPEIGVHDSAALIAQLAALWPKYLAYLISFFVLAAQWRANIELRRLEEVSYATLSWTVLYLFFVTSVPFASSVVGVHGDLAPAVWLYAANMIIVSALSLRIRLDEILPEHQAAARLGHAKIVFVMATAALSVVLSFLTPGYAMYAYLLNILWGPIAARRRAA